MQELEENTQLPKNGAIIPLDVRCGHCLHFANVKAQRYPDICSQLGILKIARPCTAFLPNVQAMSLHSNTENSLSDIMKKIPATQLAAYASLFFAERITRKQGFQFGQEIYVRLYPAEYLSNYVKAWILLATRDKLYVQGIKNSFRGMFLPRSILTVDDFEKKKRFLIARKKLIDPNLSQYTTWRPKIDNKVLKDYQPPTIDDVVGAKKPKAKSKPPVKDEGDTIFIRGKNT